MAEAYVAPGEVKQLLQHILSKQKSQKVWEHVIHSKLKSDESGHFGATVKDFPYVWPSQWLILIKN